MPIFAVLVVLSSHRDTALERYAKFAKSHPYIQVDVDSTITEKKLAGPKGTLTFDRTGNILYKGEWQGKQYLLSSTSADHVELDYAGRIYDEYDGGSGFMLMPSKISDIPGYGIPKILFAPRFDVGGATVTSTESGQITTVKITAASPQGTSIITLLIDGSGKPTEIDRYIKSPMGNSETTWKLTNYRFPKKLELKNFSALIPLGFSPFSLNRTENCLQPGEIAPVDGWIQAKTGSKVNLLKSSSTGSVLIAVLAKDGGPAEACLPSLKKLGSQVSVATVGEGYEYSDPSGKLIHTLNPAGTPTFYLVDRAGKVAKVWLGFDRNAPEKFEKEISDAVAALSKAG